VAVPEKRKATNIMSSILRFVKANFEDIHPTLSGNVNDRDRLFDVSDKRFWVDIYALEESAGKKGFTLIQFTVNSRVGGKQGGDRYGNDLSEIGDWLVDALHIDSIPIYDSSDKANPVLIPDAKIIVRNSDGIFREPDEDKRLDPIDNVARRVLTFRFITLSDVSKADRYYD